MSRIEILNLAGLRHDNRRPYELRAIALALDTAPHADGSATVTQGLTTVLASVSGPREPRTKGGGGGGQAHDRASVVVEVGVAPWAQGQARARSRGDKRLLEIGAAIRQTFEPVIMTHLYPRSEIAVHIQVVSADGGILPTAINATTLALISAGISLTDYVTSLSVGLHLAQPLLDLSAPEERDLPVLVVAALARSGKLTLAQMETRLHVDRFEHMASLAVEGCAVLKEEMEQAVKASARALVDRMAQREIAREAAAE
ncbi:Exosome non-catalytic core component [Cryptotrichosporon argae]